MAGFKDAAEFKAVFEQLFQLMNDHPEVGRRLRDAQAPHKFEITDFGLEFHVVAAPAAAEASGRFLAWHWGPAAEPPMITLTMASDVANRYFQGKENVMMAVFSGRVKIAGPMTKIMELAPVTTPINAVYREWLASHGYPHLVA